MSAARILRVAEVTTAEDLAEASDLYRDVFGYTKPEATLNPRLLLALIANGGSMVGAWDPSGPMVAFGYGFTGFSNGETYFYSQAVVVADGLQGTGIGRQIKFEQRRIALDKGLHRMRWAFNPILARNAHFNLSVLGAVGRWFAPNCYGDGESRMVVDWDLDPIDPSPTPTRWATYGDDDWGRPDPRDGLVAVPLPADRCLVTPDVVKRLDGTFAALIGDGLGARSCERQDARTAVYLFGEVQR